MFTVRPNEPEYALLKDPTSQSKNRYGKPIETVPEGHALRDKSLNINNDGEIGANPNRYKQHGFYFNADNCIACHACEAACSEKNDNPAHIAFRSVGFVEGGTYPNYQRINISMACNHCDNPVCLKGCPTRAYTKFAEYGAVLQDPDICFGCGYCTWVCPYNAPQLDPIKGQVSKCNMCVDRLEVGLKPACVAACLGKALDFGVIENIPEGRSQAKTSIPGFPRTDITHPNVRFQQTRVTQRDMRRVDSMPLKYHRDDEKGGFKPELDPQSGFSRQWNLKKLLGSHENAHIAFTLCAQSVIGAFLLLMFAPLLGVSSVVTVKNAAFLPLFATMFVILAIGMFKLNMHLGKPHRFYRGFNNWRLSPVSREIAGVSLFFAGMTGYGFFTALQQFGLWNASPAQWLANAAAVAAVIGGLFGFYYMYKLYRIPARPFWDHWQTASSFVGTALSLGASLILLVGSLALGPQFLMSSLPQLGWVVLAGLILEGLGLLAHGRDLNRQGGEGAASHYEQRSRYGNAYWLRNSLLGLNIILVSVLTLRGVPGILPLEALSLLTFLSLLVMSIIGRALFYVLVIPTTMPGAFFWRNRAFQEHARETGLAHMPQVGVVPEGH
ncbi:MAG TPA: 4Fe-4S dicluster domain-containing protein [Gammaproteobacteria bacterium]|nr:4Fe-4S dicluster domain-containing protein [Gammaproteobacteria bacterium]